jgi:hypothetical protein
MGTSYTKQPNKPQYREIPIDNSMPWEFAECMYESYCQLHCRVLDVEAELIYLKQKKPTPIIQSQYTKKPLITTANACTQTMVDTGTETMEIEAKKPIVRRWIRCSSLKKKTFYTKMYYKKKVQRDEMEIEVETKQKSRKHQKSNTTKAKTRWIKTYVKKEMMAVEIDSSPKTKKKRNPGVKTKSKGTPPDIAPRKKRPKKNSPKKILDGSDLKLKFKNFNQLEKISLMTDFFNTTVKNHVPFIKKPPDPY